MVYAMAGAIDVTVPQGRPATWSIVLRRGVYVVLGAAPGGCRFGASLHLRFGNGWTRAIARSGRSGVDMLPVRPKFAMRGS
jgi:hypothetical protein